MDGRPGRTRVLTDRRACARNEQRRLAGQLGAISATRSREEWSGDKGMPIVSWHRFKWLEDDAILTIEMPVRDDARERVNQYVVRSRANQSLMVFEVEGARAVSTNRSMDTPFGRLEPLIRIIVGKAACLEMLP